MGLRAVALIAAQEFLNIGKSRRLLVKTSCSEQEENAAAVTGDSGLHCQRIIESSDIMTGNKPGDDRSASSKRRDRTKDQENRQNQAKQSQEENLQSRTPKALLEKEEPAVGHETAFYEEFN